MDKNGMDGGQLSTNPQIHTNLLVKADINPKAYRQRGGMQGGNDRPMVGADADRGSNKRRC